MNCPDCGTPLLMFERVGVEIDRCPNCRGVWLDRGELDKILDRSRGAPADLYDREEMYDDDRHRGPKRALLRDAPRTGSTLRRNSLLRGLFDFD